MAGLASQVRQHILEWAAFPQAVRLECREHRMLEQLQNITSRITELKFTDPAGMPRWDQS